MAWGNLTDTCLAPLWKRVYIMFSIEQKQMKTYKDNGNNNEDDSERHNSWNNDINQKR